MFIADLPLYKKLSRLRSNMLAKKVSTYLTTGSRVLDFGCGNMFTAMEICDMVPDLEMIGVDVVADQNLFIDTSKYPHMTFVQSGDARLPFADNYFDHVLALACLHHTDYPEGYVTELKRVVKAGGTIIIVEEMYHHALDKWYIATSDFLLNKLKTGIPVPLNFKSHAHYLQVFEENELVIQDESYVRLFPNFMHHYVFNLVKK